MHGLILYAVVIVSILLITGDFIRLSKLSTNARAVWLTYLRTLTLFLYCTLVIRNWDLKLMDSWTINIICIFVSAVWLVSWLFERKNIGKKPL